MIFLIHYDSARNDLVSVSQYRDNERGIAGQARLALELKLARTFIDHEVVLLEALTEAGIRQTHGRYFGEVTVAAAN